MPDAAPGRKDRGIGVFPSGNQISQKLGAKHSRAHAPFLEASGDIDAGETGGIWANIGDVIQRHAILRCPAKHNFCLGIILRGKGF